MTARPLGPLRDAAAGIGGPLEAALSAGRTEDVFGSLVTELERLAPVVLVLEDLHWADDATLDVVAYLVRRIENLPVALVLTMRNDGSAGDHPLFGVLGRPGRIPGPPSCRCRRCHRPPSSNLRRVRCGPARRCTH